MSDCPIEPTEEGGDPACWAHLFEDESLEGDDSESSATRQAHCDQAPAPSGQAASGPDSARSTTRS